jgi:two-component system, NarL family, nitrate/nitrite response regulator NarL
MSKGFLPAVIVGPSELLREGLTRILSAASYRILASSISVETLALPSISQHRPILLVIDAGRDLTAAIEQIGVFKVRRPYSRVVVIGDSVASAEAISAFEAGANVYFPMDAPFNRFIKLLDLAMLGETIVPAAVLPAMAHELDTHSDPHRTFARRTSLERTQNASAPRMSAREQCILKLLIDGNSNKVIARKINVAEATVKVHIKAILRKIRVSNRTQAAIWAITHASSYAELENCSSESATDLPVLFDQATLLTKSN